MHLLLNVDSLSLAFVSEIHYLSSLFCGRYELSCYFGSASDRSDCDVNLSMSAECAIPDALPVVSQL